jgi:hypothetical protein
MLTDYCWQLESEAPNTRFVREEIKWKMVLRTLNVNIHFKSILHGFICHKSDFLQVYFSLTYIYICKYHLLLQFFISGS